MTGKQKLQIMSEVASAWVTLDDLNATIMRIGKAAHEAGATTTQHQLEVIHHNIARINRELIDTIAQINNYWRG
jgi:hypothetical protein